MSSEGLIFNIQRYAIHDGAGIRTVVFFKGCPLHCNWCSNPEGIKPYQQMAFSPQKCIGCGMCLETCPHGATMRREGGSITWRADKCDACCRCLERCYSGALERYGYTINVERLMKEVTKDRAFYDSSGGGVTLSGGDPLMQPQFAQCLLEACRSQGIATCIETSAYAPRQDFLETALLADQIYVDIKHMNSNMHRLYTGMGNELILSNITDIVRLHDNIVIRIPVIPGLNDYEKNIRQTISFLNNLERPVPVEMLPYHRMGEQKYQKLGLFYPLHDLKPPAASALAELKQMFGTAGVKCTVG